MPENRRLKSGSASIRFRPRDWLQREGGPEAPSGTHHDNAFSCLSSAEAVVRATGGLGNQSALEALANGEVAEEIARLWAEAQRDLEISAVVSVDNLLEGVSTARKVISDKPRHLMVRLLLEGKLSTCKTHI